MKHKFMVQERDNGWVELNSGETFKSPAGAMRSISRQINKLITPRTVVVTTIEWLPKGSVGKAISQAILG